MKPVHVELGALVREYRQKANMTQLDLAQKLGYDSTQFVSLFERGLSKVPFNVLGQLVIILGIPEKRIMKTLLDAYENEVKEKMETGKKTASNAG